MLTTKQKVVSFAAVGALVWLRYAKSAGGARRFLSEAGKRLEETVGSIHGAMDRMQKFTHKADLFLQEVIKTGQQYKLESDAP